MGREGGLAMVENVFFVKQHSRVCRRPVLDLRLNNNATESAGSDQDHAELQRKISTCSYTTRIKKDLYIRRRFREIGVEFCGRV